MTMTFDGIPEFHKECRQLGKKYKSLPDDLQEFCNVLPTIKVATNKHFNLMHQTDLFCIVKARLFCRYLKGTSLRIIYAHYEQEARIEYIEVYFKGDKENEDRKRIQGYIKNNQRYGTEGHTP